MVEAAPILHRMVGSTEADVRRECAAQGWTCEDLGDDPRRGEADLLPEPTEFRSPAPVVTALSAPYRWALAALADPGDGPRDGLFDRIDAA